MPEPNSSGLPPQAQAVIPGKHSSWLRFRLPIASVFVYLCVLLVGTLRTSEHLHLVLLFLQYVLILPAVLVCLRRAREPLQSVPSIPGISLPWIVVCFSVLAIPLSWFAARGLLNPDESAYSFQARIYRSGRVMADPLIGVSANFRETPAELWFTNHVLRPSGWFPKYPPGWPLLLSLGYLISTPWLLAPVFGGMGLIAIAACGWRCGSRETGSLAAYMAALSSFYLINSVGVMSHALCALLAVTACWCLFSGLETRIMGYYAGMFACLAASLQARPYTGFVLTLVMTTTALWLNRRNKLHLLKVGVTGIVFGAIACAGVLSYNHLYTGSWLVSPYAMFAGASLPPELSFNPAKIWRGIRQFAPQTIEESLIGTFPFAYLLAGYALWHEAKRRSELRILAALYTALVLAYLAHPLDSGGLPFGERFHFEAFFALLLLAARGVQLLVERWRIPRWAVVCMVLLLGVMQVSQEAAAVKAIARRGEPYRKVREAIAASGFSGLVFLRDGPGFVAKHFNLNDADWHHSRRIYLIDAEPGRRSQWACSYGALDYTVLTYDATTRQAILIPGKANCAIGTHQPSTNRCASLRKPSVNPCP